MGMEFVALPQPHSPSFLSPKRSSEPLPVWLKENEGGFLWVLCGHLWGRADQISLGWALKGSGGNQLYFPSSGRISFIGISYKFRVRALNMLGESEPSAPSRPYVVSGYSGRVYERPVAGPYITFTDAVNETTIMLKWMVSG